MSIIIGRPINGISINGDEYLLDDDNNLMEFESKKAAQDFLKKHGEFDKEALEESYNYIEKEE